MVRLKHREWGSKKIKTRICFAKNLVLFNLVLFDLVLFDHVVSCQLLVIPGLLEQNLCFRKPRLFETSKDTQVFFYSKTHRFSGKQRANRRKGFIRSKNPRKPGLVSEEKTMFLFEESQEPLFVSRRPDGVSQKKTRDHVVSCQLLVVSCDFVFLIQRAVLGVLRGLPLCGFRNEPLLVVSCFSVVSC